MYESYPGGTTVVLDRGEMALQKVKFTKARYVIKTPAGTVPNATRRRPIWTHPGIQPECVEGEHARTRTGWPFVAVCIEGPIDLSIYIYTHINKYDNYGLVHHAFMHAHTRTYVQKQKEETPKTQMHETSLMYIYKSEIQLRLRAGLR